MRLEPGEWRGALINGVKFACRNLLSSKRRKTEATACDYFVMISINETAVYGSRDELLTCRFVQSLKPTAIECYYGSVKNL